MNTHSIEIVGGGLSGLGLGIALARGGVPVTIFEAGDYPRHRVCGEFITGLDQDTIACLGLEPVLDGALQHRRVTWFARDRARAHQRLPEPALGLSRYELDQRLATRFVELGGQLRTRCRVDFAPHTPGRIWATGRRRAPHSAWLGLKAHVHGLAIDGDLELHLAPQGYIGLSRIDANTVNVCGLFHARRAAVRASAAQPREALLADTIAGFGLRRLAERLERASVSSPSFSSVAALGFDRAIPASDELRLGDACAMIPPFTGHGMAMAFQSAATSLPALLDYANGRDRWENVVQRANHAMARRFRRRLTSAALLHPVLLRGGAQPWLARFARFRLLPLGTLYSVLHG